MKSFEEIINSGSEACPRSYVLALMDTLNVVSGKWKLPIIASLFRKNTRFKDLKDNVFKITPKMLSKELKELEINGIVERTEVDHIIEYNLTASGKNMMGIIEAMIGWGLTHRELTIKNDPIPGSDGGSEI
ncbi:helix-turn-helix domain-containing protein [Sphingobacterium sp.]|uniref:winged helix-turn-helix transcriptional regulator n=1 Tax=Sphingobacterium sp. TaxID=341027 RepID=UPI00289C98AF|nr:helix-turn-helix domain-containing protein [Sphingobacterium sp.]